MGDTLLFYINAIHDGGAERVILQLAYHFANKGYRSVLVTSFKDKNEYPVPRNVERISMEDDQIIQNRFKRNLSRIIKLRKICKKEKAKAIISFMAEPNFRSIIATRGLDIKTIVSVRNDPDKEYKGKIGRMIGKYIIPLADGCVFQTDEAKIWFPTRLQKKSKVIFNAVDEIFFDTPRTDSKDIVTLGRLNEQKNQALLIKAFAKVVDKYPEQHLCIYGIGKQEAYLYSLIRELHLENQVFLMGLTDNVSLILSEAKMFVLSSDYEGMPNALMEALAIGVPSISTDCPCGGPKKLIQNGYNGLLVPVNDEVNMSKAILQLLESEEYAMELGENAKKTAEMFRTEKVFSEWQEYIEKILKQ